MTDMAPNGAADSACAFSLDLQSDTPADAVQAIVALRKEAQAEIDRLIAFLDAIEDVDADAAVDDAPCDDDEREEDAGEERELDVDSQEGDPGIEEGELDNSDAEPDLGWTGFGNMNTNFDHGEVDNNFVKTAKDKTLRQKLRKQRRTRKPGPHSNVTLEENLVGRHQVRLPNGSVVR